MKKSEEFEERLNEIKNEVIAKIKELLKERKITSLNVYTYWSDGDCTRYIYYDVDDDGYGMAMYIDTLRFDGNNLELCMNDLNDCGADTWSETELDAVNANYLLAMLEEICEYADDLYNGKFCEAGTDLNDLDD